MAFPELQRAGSNLLLIREGRGCRDQETIVQPGGRVLGPPLEIHITLSVSPSAELKPPQMTIREEDHQNPSWGP